MPSTKTVPRFVDLFRLLARHDVEVIVVGATAAVLQGAPVATFDIDLVHARTPSNVDRLLRVIGEIEGVSRLDSRRLRPGASHLLGPGQILLTTTHGDVDCLGTIGRAGAELDYAALLPHSIPMAVGDGLQIRVLALAKLIEVKREAGRAKDLAVLPTLIQTLEEIEQHAARSGGDNVPAMSIQERVVADLQQAMLAKDELSRDTLRMVKADLMNKGVELGRDLTEAEEIAVLQRAVKTRQDSIDEYQKVGRADAAAREQAEIGIVQRYLPAQMDEAAARTAISAVIAELGLSGKKDMGKLMKEIKSRHGATVDGKLASRLAGELLG